MKVVVVIDSFCVALRRSWSTEKMHRSPQMYPDSQ